MTDNEIFATVTRAIEDRLGYTPDPITPDTNLLEDLSLDSLHIVDLCIALEETLGIDMLADEITIKDICTVGDLVKAISDVQPATAAPQAMLARLGAAARWRPRPRG